MRHTYKPYPGTRRVSNIRQYSLWVTRRKWQRISGKQRCVTLRVGVPRHGPHLAPRAHKGYHVVVGLNARVYARIFILDSLISSCVNRETFLLEFIDLSRPPAFETMATVKPQLQVKHQRTNFGYKTFVAPYSMFKTSKSEWAFAGR